MTRINVYQYLTEDELGVYGDAPALVGWFNPAAAARYDEGTRWDGNNHISLVTGSQWDHEIIFATKGGRWVLHHWSQWQGRPETYEYISDERAREWLIRSEYPSEQIAQIFGEDLPDERGPGRPEIGPAVNVRFPAETLTKLDAAAAVRGVSRAEVIRSAVADLVDEIGL